MNGNIKTMVEKGYENYDSPIIVNEAWNFMRDLVTLVRARTATSRDQGKRREIKSSYQTFWTVLTTYTKALAPLIPFVTEEIYRNLTGEESVHFANWPETGAVDGALEKEMEDAKTVSSLILAFRKEKNVKVKIPFKKITYKGPRELTDEVKQVVLSEGNVYALVYSGQNDGYAVSGEYGEGNQDVEAGMVRDLIRDVQNLRKEKGCNIHDKIQLVLPNSAKNLPEDKLEQIKVKTLAGSITWGESLSLSIG